ncbi:hypothetical protein [Nocardia africana]
MPSRITWIGRDKAPAPAPAPAANPGEPLPDPSGGRVCPVCAAYAIDPDRHAAWHAETSQWRGGIDRLKALVLRVFLARGYITTTENTATTDGNTEDA